MEIAPIRQTSLGEQVAAELRRLIARRAVTPGAQIAEESLASRFGVSRGPVRDALKVLASEGLVEFRGRRAFMRGLEPVDIDELFSLRQMLESTALRMALKNDRRALVGLLDEAIDQMRVAEQGGSPTDFASADLTYHTAFYEIAGHSRLRQIWDQFRPSISLVLLASRETYLDLTPSVDSHVILRDLIAAGDVEPALTELVAHTENARQRVRVFYEDEAPSDTQSADKEPAAATPTT